MRNTLIIILLLISQNAFSQILNKRGSMRLMSLGVDRSNFDSSKKRINNDFSLILRKDRKYKTNKTFGIISASYSVFSITTGILLSSKSNNSDSAMPDVFGAVMVGTGIVYGGISIPFFILSKKRKRERNRIIQKYRK